MDEAATHRSLMVAASIQPSWNSSSRWEQSKQSCSFKSSTVDSTGYFVVQHQRRQYSKGRGTEGEKSNQARKEQDKIGTRSRETQRSVFLWNQCQVFANKGFGLALILMLLCFHMWSATDAKRRAGNQRKRSKARKG